MPFQIGVFEATALVYPLTARTGDEELRKMLNFLREAGIPLILISTEPKEFITDLERLGIAGYFERFFLGVSDRQVIINEVLRRYPRVDLRDVFYVDIEPEGIADASKAKIVPFALFGKKHTLPEMQAAGAKWAVHSYQDLTSILRANIA